MAKVSGYEPPDAALAEAYQLVGEFMFHWAYLETRINNAINSILEIDGGDALILTANITVRDKIHILQTMAHFYLGPEAVADANALFKQIGTASGNRNLVAHNVFLPHKKGIEFQVVKAKGKLSFPGILWTKEQFALRFAEMCILADEVTALAKTVARWRSRIKNPPNALNALAMRSTADSEPRGLLSFLDLLPQPDPSSQRASPETEAQTPKAPRKKPKAEKAE